MSQRSERLTACSVTEIDPSAPAGALRRGVAGGETRRLGSSSSPLTARGQMNTNYGTSTRMRRTASRPRIANDGGAAARRQDTPVWSIVDGKSKLGPWNAPCLTRPARPRRCPVPPAVRRSARASGWPPLGDGCSARPRSWTLLDEPESATRDGAARHPRRALRRRGPLVAALAAHRHRARSRGCSVRAPPACGRATAFGPGGRCGPTRPGRQRAGRALAELSAFRVWGHLAQRAHRGKKYSITASRSSARFSQPCRRHRVRRGRGQRHGDHHPSNHRRLTCTAAAIGQAGQRACCWRFRRRTRTCSTSRGSWRPRVIPELIRRRHASSRSQPGQHNAHILRVDPPRDAAGC